MNQAALIISYEFPPKGGSGVQRVVKWAKFLPEYGWRAHILTVKDVPAGMLDETLLAEIPTDSRIARAFSLEPTRLYRALSKLKPKRRAARPEGQKGDKGGQRGVTNLPYWAIRLMQAPFFPDEKIGWLPWAIRAGLAAIEDEKMIEVLISTSPPASSHLVGLALHRRTGLPWIADFRDPWVGNEFKAPITPLHGLVDKRLEARVISAATHVTVANGATTRALGERYPAEAGKFHTLTNGFDPDDFRLPPPISMHPGFNIVHTGTFYAERNPRAFLEAIAELCAEDAEFADAVRIWFVGPGDRETDRLAAESPIKDKIAQTGYVSHRESVAYLLASEALLLIVSPGAESRRHLAGKIFEYLAAKRPILALVGEGEASSLIQEAEAGLIVDPTRVPEIKKAVRRIFDEYRAGRSGINSKEEVIARFDRRLVSGRLAGLLDELGHDS